MVKPLFLGTPLPDFELLPLVFSLLADLSPLSCRVIFTIAGLYCLIIPYHSSPFVLLTIFKSMPSHTHFSCHAYTHTSVISLTLFIFSHPSTRMEYALISKDL